MKLLILVAVITVFGFGIQSAYACSEANIEHWTSIAFVIKDPISHDTLPDLEPGNVFPPIFNNNIIDRIGGFNAPSGNTQNPNIFEMRLQVGASEVVLVQQKIVDELIVRGYFNGTHLGEPINPQAIMIRDIDYSTICNDPFMAIGGILVQPDTYTLLLAYGIANSIWMAPLAIGIGVGVYLTKSKWKKD